MFGGDTIQSLKEGDSAEGFAQGTVLLVMHGIFKAAALAL